MNAIAGFVLILLLGFAGSRLALFRGRFSLGLQSIFLAGTEFLFIGVILGPYAANVLTESALQRLAPILSLGLGWIGLLIGLQFDRRVVRRIPAAIWWTGAAISLVCFSTVFLALWSARGLLLRMLPLSFADDLSWSRFGTLAETSFCVLLAAASTESTYTALALAKRRTDARGETIKLLQLLTDIRAPLAIIGMGAWYCLYHISNQGTLSGIIPENASLPNKIMDAPLDGISLEAFYCPPIMHGGLWLAAALLLGVSLGWMLHYLTSERMESREMLLALTGSVVLSTGLAASLHLSPLFVNFIMGATLSNLPNFARGRVSNLLTAMEKPFFVIFMILTGALLPAITPMALAFVSLYLFARVLGLYAGMRWANALFLKSKIPILPRLGLAMLPQGGVAIALAIDYKLIYPGRWADLALSVAILSVLVNQLIGPALLMRALRRSGDISAPDWRNLAKSNSS
ncbi:MAG: hypothetical protein AB1656_04815 [Candidatus Omnitrophota bacterium]